VARALIVGCGCRGRALGAGLAEQGWLVRGTSRFDTALAQIDATGIEAVQGDPARVGDVLDHVADVTLVFWLLGTATGEEAEVAALHDQLLQRLLEEFIDTPVRGVVYEAAGSVAPELLRRGAEIVEAARSTWRIPAEVVRADPADIAVWTSAMLAATARLTGA